MSGRDTKIYRVCEPWNGERGPSWMEVFEKDFISGLGEINDDYTNLKQVLFGQDPGGVPATTAAQLAANPAHINPANAHQGQLALLLSSCRCTHAH